MNWRHFHLVFLLIALAPLGLSQAYAQAHQDTTAEGNPIYRNVDVTVDFAWSDMERYDAVDATVKLNGKSPQAVIVRLNDGTRFEIQLIDEVTIKIYDHQTGKLLRVLGNSRAT